MIKCSNQMLKSPDTQITRSQQLGLLVLLGLLILYVIARVGW